MTLERIEEKCIHFENEKNDGKKELEPMSTHAIEALIPVGIVHFSRLITVHIKNYFSAMRNISYFCLFRGKGDGSMALRCFLCKRKRFLGTEKLKMNQSGIYLKSI